MSELKPCPFCGSTEVRVKVNSGIRPDEESYWVDCEECSACLGGASFETDAISMWNARKGCGIVGGKIPEPLISDTIVQAVWDASQYVDDLIERGIESRKLVMPVRCADCLFWGDCGEEGKSRYCRALCCNMKSDDYCSYGKMKGTATHDAPRRKTEGGMRVMELMQELCNVGFDKDTEIVFSLRGEDGIETIYRPWVFYTQQPASLNILGIDIKRREE